jgi:hypothetical protein
MRQAAPNDKTEVVIFDEMETFEHTKCKPVSIPLAVDEKTRRILAIGAVPMPAKGTLAAKARKKYGRRMDNRSIGLETVLTRVKYLAPKMTLLKSDQCPRYPGLVTTTFGDELDHQTFKGRRGCVVGQGELKNSAHDPLFSLNHTCAMLRDNLKRLTRRTWATTKCIFRLRLLVTLYAWVHNQLREGATWRLKMP